MPRLIVTDRAGVSTTVEGPVDHSVMEVIRDNGFDELLALCGGCCSCATCHVYVDPAFAARLPPPSEDEDDLLESCEQRTPASRLACQIRFEGELEDLHVTLAPQE